MISPVAPGIESFRGTIAYRLGEVGMGTSYQTVLVAASIARLRSALEVDGVEALLVPAGPDRTAVLPREGDYDIADSNGVAASLSADLKVDALSQQVVDSDLVVSARR
jgi:hypothetical protein